MASDLREIEDKLTVAERAFVPIFFVAVSAIAILFSYYSIIAQNFNLTLTFLRKQDIWLILSGTLILLISLVRLPASQRPPAIRMRTILIFGMVMGVLAGLGRQFILLGYDMSRDEQLASFDAAIFSSGRLAAPLRQPWGQHAEALNTTFMLPAAGRSGWVSGYLPMNAAVRGLFETVGAADLVGPLTVLLGAVALWACARRIWPSDRSAAVLALLLYFGSGQVLLNGMTSYAMPLHLTSNLIWLWLFLQNRLKSDLLALCVGFFAVGLHQPVFHPIFAMPILVGVVLERDLRRSAVYFIGYLFIGAFWFWWPHFSVEITGAPFPNGEAGYLSRLTLEWSRRQSGGALLMMANLIRFVAWQHLLLLPLLLIGIRYAIKGRLMSGLAGGIALTIIIMAAILPYQGHGFGYRYLHGLIGNAIILAVAGWRELREEFPEWNSLIFRTTIGGLLIILPMQFYFAHEFYAPFAEASRAIDRSDADFVLVKGVGAPFASDLVINDPFLRNKPIRLLEEYADEGMLADICGDGATISRLPAPYYDRIQIFFGEEKYSRIERISKKPEINIRKFGCKLN